MHVIDIQEAVQTSVLAHSSAYITASDDIWDHPEMNFHEDYSAGVIRQILLDHDFSLTDNLGGMPNAFRAEYGSGSPVIAYLGEFDALSSLSQKAGCAVKDPITPGAPGHGCGHNLLGVGALGAAIAVKEMIAAGVKPEIEVFDMGMLNTAKYYLKTGILQGPAHFQICLGAPGGMEATTENLLYMVNHLPEDCTWSTFGIGKGANEVMLAALALGGNIRVGLEDNVYYNAGQKAESNAQFVERVKRLAAEVGRTLATPDEAREILHL